MAPDSSAEWISGIRPTRPENQEKDNAEEERRGTSIEGLETRGVDSEEQESTQAWAIDTQNTNAESSKMHPMDRGIDSHRSMLHRLLECPATNSQLQELTQVLSKAISMMENANWEGAHFFVEVGELLYSYLLIYHPELNSDNLAETKTTILEAMKRGNRVLSEMSVTEETRPSRTSLLTESTELMRNYAILFRYGSDTAMADVKKRTEVFRQKLIDQASKRSHSPERTDSFGV